MSVRKYFEIFTDIYRAYALGAHGWHFGIWDNGINTHEESLLRSNERLLEDIEITSNTSILDMGCGDGGFAAWAASKFGCRVTGITIVPEHAALAQDLVHERGVSYLCEFMVMDMLNAKLPAETFDIVTNQESLCYAVDTAAYLNQVKRILKPGGFWRAMAFSIKDKLLSDHEKRWYEEVRSGFHIPSLLPERRIKEILRQSGYSSYITRDISRQTYPTAHCLMRLAIDPRTPDEVRSSREITSREAADRSYHLNHFRAVWSFCRGLTEGCFRYCWYSACK